jgi:mRNA interferase HigB
MRLLGKQRLHDFKEKHADARSKIESWEAEVESAGWKNPHELKGRYPSADTPGNQQAIFNIGGDRYRLWAQVEYKQGIVLVKNIGTHKEYDKWEIV